MQIMKKDTETSSIFETMPVPKALRTMIIPTIFGQIVVLIYNLADTFYVGRTGNPYMVAGVSLILPVFNILIALANLAGVGGSSYISRLLGIGRQEEASRVSSFSIYFSVCLAALFSVCVAVFLEPLLHLLGAGENTFLYAKQYVLCVIVFGGIPTILANVLSNILRSTGAARQAGVGVAMGGILNIILDPLFMFVLLPKGYEIVGVGIATCLSNILSCLYYLFVIYSIRKDTIISLRPALVSRQSMGNIFNVGVPASITMLLFDLDYMIIDRLMAGYSDIALAAVGIVLKAERLPLNIGVGICQGMVPMIAYSYSAKNYGRMREIIRHARKVGLIAAAISVTLYEIFASGILRVFINDAATIGLGARFLRARCLATPVMFLSFFTVHSFQAFGKGRVAMGLGLLRWIGLNIPMLFILNALFGMYGIVWAQVTADFINMVV